MSIILSFGVYDMLHIGHMLLFKRTKEIIASLEYIQNELNGVPNVAK